MLQNVISDLSSNAFKLQADVHRHYHPSQRACAPTLILLATKRQVKLFETHCFTVVITALCGIFLITLTFSNLTLNYIKICLRPRYTKPCTNLVVWVARTVRMHINRAVIARLSLPRRSGYAHVHGGRTNECPISLNFLFI